MSNNSLRPGWNRQGFQPPPPADNTFVEPPEQHRQSSSNNNNSNSNNNPNSRNNSNNNGAAPPPIKGRSLADLARGGGGNNSTNSNHPARSASARSGNHNTAVAGSTTTTGVAAVVQPVTSAVTATAAAPAPPAIDSNAPKVPRYTREKLLSLRTANSEPPEAIQLLIEEIKYEDPQDPVCWDDTFDADEIWSAKRKTVVEQQQQLQQQQQQTRGPRRDSSFASSRWQRGVALPAPDKRTTSTSTKDAASPDELWDDPQAEEKDTIDAFDFEKMAENSRKLEEEMRASTSRSRSSSTDEPSAGANATNTATETNNGGTIVDPNRPLASAGTTIRSGSGDDVNVFEDFDEPVTPPLQMIRAATEDQSASSRLMAMIGVQKKEEPAPPPIPTPSPVEAEEPPAVVSDDEPTSFISVPSIVAQADVPRHAMTIESKTPPVEPVPQPIVPVPALSWGLPGTSDITSTTSIPLNPWGGLGAALPIQTQLAEQQRLAEEKKRALLEEQERLRRREQQERLIKEQQQREAQVELVLIERISSILESSWGRADLRSILSTLHAEDSRVISLLNSVDALRALLFRHHRRIAIRSDPGMGTEIAILLMTNMQWRSSEQDPALSAPQQQQQRQRASKVQEMPPVIPALPWFYSDPSKNIQGPFRGQEMRQWLEAGYFKGDLPISQNPKGPFLSLSLFFPNLAEAFKISAYQAEEEAEAADRREAEIREARLRQQREAERLEIVRRDAERRETERREAERREAERREAERREAERREAQQQARASAALEQRIVQNGGDSDSAAKLKMMLGLGVVESSSGEAKASSTNKAQVAPAPNNSYPLKPIEFPPQPKPSKPTRTSSQTTISKEKLAWGGAAQPTSRKSMSEIQQEEARAAAVAAMNRSANPGGNNGWANVAASRSGSLNTNWNAKQNAVALRQPSRALSMQPQPAQRKQPMRSQSEMDAPTDAFGAKMSPAFEQWAKDQMKRINGTDDLTLVAFCMTLQDPDEIRQYLSAYLGANSIVNTFASEFINRKNDDWESTARKGRKKKTP
jgi:GYF domain